MQELGPRLSNELVLNFFAKTMLLRRFSGLFCMFLGNDIAFVCRWHNTLHFWQKIHGHVPSTDKSNVIFKKHARWARKCALAVVFCGGNAGHGDVTACRRWYTNICVSARKGTRNYGFREEMCSRACATSGRRSSCISKRKASQALQFPSEIDCRTHIFFTKQKGLTTISYQKRRLGCHQLIAT